MKINLKTVIITIITVFSVITFAIGIYFVWDFSRPISVINVIGKASEKVKPDKIQLYFTTSVAGTNQEVANSENDIKTTKAVEILKAENIEENKIKTRKNIFPDYDYNNIPINDRVNEPTKKPEKMYRAETSFEVEIGISEDTQKINKLSEKLTVIGIQNFNQNEFKISNKEEICKNLEYKAIENATIESKKKIAAIGGGQIKKREISTINNCGGNNNYPMARNAMANETADSSATGVLTGENELTVEVSMIITYKN